MANQPHTTLHLDREGLDHVGVTACVTGAGRLLGSVEFAGIEIYNSGDLSATDFADGLHRIADELKRVAVRKLSEAFRVQHPEEPTPIGRGGRCLGCGRIVAMLFTARVSLGGSAWDSVEACASCANVRDDLAEVFDAATIKVNPEGDDPRAIREEQHDLGMDVPA